MVFYNDYGNKREKIMRNLTWGARISYGAGAFGKDLVYAIVATF